MEAAAILGSKKWTPKWGPFSGQFLASQALAFWQWCNFALREASREPLVINLDESSIGFHWSGLFGTVSDREATDKVKSTTAKARATYICAVTHDPEVQQLLPQVLLGNTRCFTTAFVQQAAELFPHLVVWREKSAWNTQRLMAKYLRCLGDRLGPILETRQVYLLLDLAPCHLHDSLFDLAYTLGLRFLYIPPGMTSLLQPCDSHVFAAFKHDLQETWRQRKATAWQDKSLWKSGWKLLPWLSQSLLPSRGGMRLTAMEFSIASRKLHLLCSASLAGLTFRLCLRHF